MGCYTFKWEHPAEEVFVTGTFDDWTKSEQLDKVGDIFKKTVHFKDASKKIYYKFVVDSAWIINESSPKEADHEGNVNNFLTPEDMASEETVPVIATVTADSTTAGLAGEQPIEKNEGIPTPSDIPGGFPETPSPSNELDKPVGVNPLPAAFGAVNPIKLAPGEPVPDFTAESVNDYVKLDEASYEKSDALPGIDAADLEPPAISDNMIPEASLPVVDATSAHINTVGATTLAMAADVPLEAKVPEVVKESQKEAGFEPEASAIPEGVREKALVEEELMDKVHEVPAASENAPVETRAHEAAAVTAVDDAVVAPAAVTTEIPPVEEKAAPVADEAIAVTSAPEPAEETAPEPVQEPLAQHDEPKVEQEEKPAETVPEVPAQASEELVAEPSEGTEVKAEETKPEEVKPEGAEVEDFQPEYVEAEEVKPEDAKIEETQPAEVKAEEAKPEEAVFVPAAAAEIPETEVVKDEPPAIEAPAIEAAKTEAPAAEVAKFDGPAETAAVDEAATAEAPVPESTGVTQVEDPAILDTAAERPHLDIPRAETPKSERTEVSPSGEAPNADAQANGTEEKVPSSPSDKKRGRFSAFFSRFRSRLSNK